MYEVEQRLPANEVPLWTAWQHIEPWGWPAHNLQTARAARMNMAIHRGSENLPPLSDFMAPDIDWREFDRELKQELETERLIRNMKAIMPGERRAETGN